MTNVIKETDQLKRAGCSKYFKKETGRRQILCQQLEVSTTRYPTEFRKPGCDGSQNTGTEIETGPTEY